MPSAKLFIRNGSQSLELPQDVSFPGNVKEVDIVKIGRCLIVSPSGFTWDDFFNEKTGWDDDFLSDRAQDLVAFDEKDTFQ